jgi:hypothetical protein
MEVEMIYTCNKAMGPTYTGIFNRSEAVIVHVLLLCKYRICLQVEQPSLSADC